MNSRLLLLFIFLFVTIIPTKAQVSLIDSLNKNIATQKNAPLVDSYNALAQAHYNGAPQKIYIYASKALELSQKIGYNEGYATALCRMGLYYQKIGDYTQARGSFNKSLEEANKLDNLKLIAEARAWQGERCHLQDDDYHALSYYNEALDFYQKAKYPDGSALVYTLLGNVYKEQFNNLQVAKCFQEALKITQKTNNKPLIITCQIALAELFTSNKNYTQAQEMITKAIANATNTNDLYAANKANYALAMIHLQQGLYTEAINLFTSVIAKGQTTYNNTLLSNCFNNLAIAYFFNKNTPLALSNVDSAIYISEGANNKKLLADALITKAEILSSNNRNGEAFACVSKAIALAFITQNTHQAQRSAELSSKLLYRQGNSKAAFEMLSKSNQLKDSLNNEDKIKKQTQFELELQFNQKLEQDSLMRLAEEQNKSIQDQKKDSEQQDQIAMQRNIIIAIAIGVLILSLFAYNLMRSVKKVRNLNKQLEEQKTEIEVRREKLQLQNEEIIKQRNAIQETNKEITDSIHYAKRIQRALLTSNDFIKRHVTDTFIYYQPKDIVSGDFYWATNIGNKFMIATADSTGHGVPGAFMSVLGVSFLAEIVNDKKINKPNDVLDTLRDSIINVLNPEGSQEATRDGIDMSLCLYDFETNTLEVSSANSSVYIYRKAGSKGLIVNSKQQIPINYNQNGALYELKGDKFPVGKHTGEQLPFTLYKITIEKGDTVFTSTDGYADQFGGLHRKKLKYNQLEALLLNAGNSSCEDQQHTLTKFFNEWKGSEEQIDDVLVIAIKV